MRHLTDGSEEAADPQRVVLGKRAQENIQPKTGYMLLNWGNASDAANGEARAAGAYEGMRCSMASMSSCRE